MEAEGVTPEIYGVAAFLTVSRLMEVLVEKNVLSDPERSDLWSLVAGGLNGNDPGVAAMRKLLRQLAGSDGSTQ